MVEYNSVSGYPSQVIELLNRKIGQYKRAYIHVKIGITGQDPQDRFNQHRQEIQWERMIVIYESSSADHCNLLEAWLVEQHYNEVTNVRQGGSSELSVPGKNYVYVLLM